MRAQQTVVDAIDLRKHVRQERMQPVVAQVEHLHLLVAQHLLNVRARPARAQALQDLAVAHVA